MLEYMLDCIELLFAEAHQDKVGLPGRVEQQLGDDLVGAAQVNQPDVRKIEQRNPRLVGVCQCRLNTAAHRPPGGARDQVAVWRLHRLTQ